MASYNVDCPCGGKSSTTSCFRNAHRLTKRHIAWAAENPHVEFRVIKNTIYRYACPCGSKLVSTDKKNISMHEKSHKHQKFINKDSKNEPILI